jgi:outer membrane immunogenic protein
MRKLLLAGTALTAMLGAPAMAADLAVRTPPPVYRAPPPVVAYFTWTGCFVGGNVGGIWVEREATLVSTFPGGPAVGTTFGSHDTDGFIGGVQGGCDYQVGPWVFGVQGDYNWADVNGSHVDPFFAGHTHHVDTKSLASVTGRVGYAWDRFLAYVKAGGAWERDDHSITGPLFVTTTSGETRGGWTVGVGGEYAFTNWLSGFVEYDYYQFDDRTRTVVCGVPGCLPGGASAFSVDIEDRKHVVKAGINVRFNLFR